MRRAALFTLALALSACGGEPLGQTWEVDEGGNPVPGTERTVWTQDEVVAIRQGLAANVAYNIECGGVLRPFRGEVMLFSARNFGGECNVMKGKGLPPAPPQNMAISFNDPTAKWKSGKSWNDKVRSLKAREPGTSALFGHVGMCIRLRQSVKGGDSPTFGNALFEMGPDGTLSKGSLAPFDDASFMVVRYKDASGACPL